NYQRFTRKLDNGWQVPYIVAGGGGYYDLYPVGIYQFGQQPAPVKLPLDRTDPNRRLEAFVDSYYGYLRRTVSPTQSQGGFTATQITGAFQPCWPGALTSKYHPLVPKTYSTDVPTDPFIVDLKKHTVSKGG